MACHSLAWSSPGPQEAPTNRCHRHNPPPGSCDERQGEHTTKQVPAEPGVNGCQPGKWAQQNLLKTQRTEPRSEYTELFSPEPFTPQARHTLSPSFLTPKEGQNLSSRKTGPQVHRHYLISRQRFSVWSLDQQHHQGSYQTCRSSSVLPQPCGVQQSVL